jgi:hypothetical protein
LRLQFSQDRDATDQQHRGGRREVMLHQDSDSESDRARKRCDFEHARPSAHPALALGSRRPSYAGSRQHAMWRSS